MASPQITKFSVVFFLGARALDHVPSSKSSLYGDGFGATPASAAGLRCPASSTPPALNP